MISMKRLFLLSSILLGYAASPALAFESEVGTNRMACIRQAKLELWKMASAPNPTNRVIRIDLDPEATLEPVIMELVYVPGGTVTAPDDRPISIAPFWMCKTEVRHVEYKVYQEDWGETYPGAPKEEQRDKEGIYDCVTGPSPDAFVLSGLARTDTNLDHRSPMSVVNVRNAQTFTFWLSQRTGHIVRLPTEAEWLHAALGGRETLYPADWELEVVHAPTQDDGYTLDHVGSRRANPYGIHDLLGNVGEWVLGGWSDTPLAPLRHAEHRYDGLLVGGCYADTIVPGPTWPRAKLIPGWQKTDPQVPKSSWFLSDGNHTGFRVIIPATKPDLKATIAAWTSGFERKRDRETRSP